MIENQYGRSAIGEVIGYIEERGVFEETSMHIRIENTLLAIPVDEAKKQAIMRAYPAGSQVSASFYNCEWHIEGLAAASTTAGPSIGIPIRDLLNHHQHAVPEKYVPPEPMGEGPFDSHRISDHQEKDEGFASPVKKFQHDIDLEREADSEELSDDFVSSARDYLNEIEIDFHGQAEAILERIQLSHLIVHAI